MNDFTKEELELLYRHMVLTVNWNTLLSEKDNAVMDKIDSMIVNYCEHKKTVPNYDCKTQCEDCGIIL